MDWKGWPARTGGWPAEVCRQVTAGDMETRMASGEAAVVPRSYGRPAAFRAPANSALVEV